jgi:hypothetical protein
MVEPMQHLAEDCRSDAEWLRAAANFLESADVRIMIGFAATECEAQKAA